MGTAASTPSAKATRVREAASDTVFRTVSLVVLCVWLVALLFPLYWLFSSSLKDPREVPANPPAIVPQPPIRFVIQLDYSKLSSTASQAELEKAIRADMVIASMIGYDRFTAHGLNSVRGEAYVDGRLVGQVESDKSMVAYRILFLPATTITESYLLGKDRYEKFFTEAVSPLGTRPRARFDFSGQGMGAFRPARLANDHRDSMLKDFMTKEVAYQGELIGFGTEHWLGGFLIRFLEPLLKKTNLPPFHHYIFNSILATGSEIIITLLISTMAAYALSRLMSPRAARIWILYFLISLMVPTVATIVPGVFLAKFLGVFNTLWAVILFAVPNAFIIYIMKGFIDALPGSYFDAARIEGASEFRVYSMVVIPLITASLAVAVLLIFLGSWNRFFWPFIVLNLPKKYTFPVALYFLTTQVDQENPAQQFVFGVMSSIPTLLVFAFFQKRMGRGIMWTGIKG